MKKYFFPFLIVALAALNWQAWQEVFAASRTILEVRFFDVGQGDGAMLQTAQGHQVIIDGGPDSSLLERLAETMPFWDRSIDLVVLTHPDKDHVQGLFAVLEKYQVDHILWTGVRKNSPEADRWETVVAREREAGARVVFALAGHRITAGDVRLDIVSQPQSVAGVSMNDVNETSVVLRAVHGENAFLFTGDIGQPTERQLAALGADVSATVLKVPHHGSRYSSSAGFLEAVGAKYAVISSGKNSYGHPTQETIIRLQAAGAEVLRTDQRGTVTMESNGQELYVTTER